MEHRETGQETEAAHSPLASAALSGALEAARALERACRHSREAQDSERRLYLGTVADLARSLGDDLNSLAQPTNASSSAALVNSTLVNTALVSAALRAADLATLAACALPELPPHSPEYHRVAASAHAASGAARSLALEHRALGASNEEDYAAYDLRGAEWRASLAARQTDEALHPED